MSHLSGAKKRLFHFEFEFSDDIISLEIQSVTQSENAIAMRYSLFSNAKFVIMLYRGRVHMLDFLSYVVPNIMGYVMYDVTANDMYDIMSDVIYNLMSWVILCQISWLFIHIFLKRLNKTLKFNLHKI